jgi:hypothetical protein
MNGMIPKISVVDELSEQSAPPLVLMTKPPADALKREEIGNHIWAGLVLRFEEGLSERDKWLWNNAPDTWTKSAEHVRLSHEFDAFLVHFGFSSFGPAMFWSLELQKRLLAWRDNEPTLFELMGKALKLHSMVWLGKKKAPWINDLDKFADGAIQELRKLLRRQRDEFGSRRGTPSCGRIAGWMKLEIEAHPEEFRFLRAELAQLCGWVENLPGQNQTLARTLCKRGLRGDTFFYLWYAAMSKRSVKHVRNRIAYLRTHH